MATTRHILERRRAAQNISKVTHTMETISAVRYQQYYRQWADGQEFYNDLAQMAYLLVTAQESIRHPLMEPSESRRYAVLIIGSDRGLCGAYNSNLFKLLEVHSKMAKRFRRELVIYAKGRKVETYLQNRGIKPAKVYRDFQDVPTSAEAKAIGDHFIDQYLNGQIGRFGIIYNRFYNVASQQAQTLAVLPVADLIDDLTTRATIMWPYEVDFEDFILSPSGEEIFGSLARMMVHTVIQGCFLEAALSEHLSRVVAMRSATDNAHEMIDDLTKEYNRARQAQITTELMDIIGGVESA